MSDAQGTSYGAPCELENVLAKIVIDRVPSIEMVRFVNSGTEACLSVLRLMRAYTKRDKVCSHAYDCCDSPNPLGCQMYQVRALKFLVVGLSFPPDAKHCAAKW